MRTSLSRPAKGDALHLHFVNYNRTEPAKPKSAGGGIHDEKPIAAEGVRFSFRVPEGKILKHIRFLTPENDKAIELRATSSGNQMQINVPKFLVYGVVELKFE